MEVLPTSATPAKLGYSLQPRMGVRNELIAVGMLILIQLTAGMYILVRHTRCP